MSSAAIRFLDSGAWAERNPNVCECRGRGWLLSDYDTWHQCPIHGKNVPCPEQDGEDGMGFDWDAHMIKVLTEAYDYYCREAVRLGLKGFDHAVRSKAGNELSSRVNVADEILTDVYRNREEDAARAAGYSYALEMSYAEEAAYERGC